MLNQTVLVGRLTKDPEIVTHENGKKISAITLAVQRSFKNTEGIYETDFIRCILWNGIAENTCEYCHTLVMSLALKGRLQTSSYQDETGKTIYVTEVVAERVTFLTSKKEESNK
jgi:single-strand DNA-binding protein